jgi:type II secretory pathway component GspD/PulD (secretin)
MEEMMSFYPNENRKIFLKNTLLMSLYCLIIGVLLISPALSQSKDTIESSLVIPQPPVEKATKIFRIQFGTAQDIQNMAQPLLTDSGRMTRDDRTNLLIVMDIPVAIARIEELIASVDIPLETLIIPIKYADVNDVARVVTKASPRSKINVDTRLNSIIITDIATNIAQIKGLVDQIESSVIQRPQIGLDCGVIKVTLNEKNSTGIDWSKCPFIRKTNKSSTIYMDNVKYEEMLEWLSKCGTAELLSRKRVTVTPNEETRVREGIRYQTIEKQPISMDTLGSAKIPGCHQSGRFRFYLPVFSQTNR